MAALITPDMALGAPALMERESAIPWVISQASNAPMRKKLEPARKSRFNRVMTSQPPAKRPAAPAAKKPPRQDRESRLEEALRANLRRRKDQARARQSPPKAERS